MRLSLKSNKNTRGSILIFLSRAVYAIVSICLSHNINQASHCYYEQQYSDTTKATYAFCPDDNHMKDLTCAVETPMSQQDIDESRRLVQHLGRINAYDILSHTKPVYTLMLPLGMRNAFIDIILNMKRSFAIQLIEELKLLFTALNIHSISLHAKETILFIQSIAPLHSENRKNVFHNMLKLNDYLPECNREFNIMSIGQTLVPINMCERDEFINTIQVVFTGFVQDYTQIAQIIPTLYHNGNRSYTIGLWTNYHTIAV